MCSEVSVPWWLTLCVSIQFKPLHKSLLMMKRSGPVSSSSSLHLAVEASLRPLSSSSTMWWELPLAAGPAEHQPGKHQLCCPPGGTQEEMETDVSDGLGATYSPSFTMGAWPWLCSPACDWACVWEERQTERDWNIVKERGGREEE